MPWWLLIYLAGYGVFTYKWSRDHLRENGSKLSLSAELASDACMVIAALAYWLPSVRLLLGNAATLIFVAGLAWLFVAAIRDLRESWPSSEPLWLQIGTTIFVLSFLGAICGPLVYWGYSYAVLGKTGGT